MFGNLFGKIGSYIPTLAVSVTTGCSMGDDGSNNAIGNAMSPNSVSLNATNTSNATQLISSYLKMFGVIVIAIGIIFIAVNMLKDRDRPEARAEGMQNLMKIAIGATIIGSAVLMAGWLIGLANSSAVTLNVGKIAEDEGVLNNTDDSGNFFIRAIANALEAFPNALINWVGKLAGFQPLTQLIFNTDSSLTLPPFKPDEWQNLSALYLAVSSFTAPLILIMIGKTGIAYVADTGSVSKKVDLKEEFMHWILCVTIIVIGPLLVQGLIQLCNMFTDILNTTTKSMWTLHAGSYLTDFTETVKIRTGNILTDAIVHFLYAYLYLKVNIIFMVRKIMLSVMYVFTPIAVALWGINRRVEAFSIWFGEILTNAAMQFFYAFTVIVAAVSFGSAGWNSWLYTLIWMFAIIKIAEVLRNSLQGFIARVSGIDEERLGMGAVTQAGEMVAGFAGAFNAGRNTGSSTFKPVQTANVAKQVFGGAMGKGSSSSALRKSANNHGPAGFTGSTSANPPTNPNSPSGAGSETSSSGEDFSENSAGSDSAGSSESGTQSPETSNSTGNITGENETMGKLRADSAKQALYDNLLADNINRNGASAGTSIPSHVMNLAERLGKAQMMGDPAFTGIVNSAHAVRGKIQNRLAVGRGINQTLDQMQRMSGMSKQEAVQTLFGGNGKSRFNGNKFKFVHSITKGDTAEAESILAQAHPFNKLNQEQKDDIIMQSNPYTSMDGFSSWKDV